MRIYRGEVTLKDQRGKASHFIDVEEGAMGNTEFHFERIVYNLDDDKKFRIPEMRSATFKEQLRSLNKASAITRVQNSQFEKFIESMLKEAYPEAGDIEIEELH
jgi:hypothetical protein